ncbi:MAG: N-acetyl-gamma-glutamyl-phosphate reductase, partial [Clostridia bacterium]|nr:N-acetyl-gamma-glutamyl-phosphate reductase [Clostridia bacterium]
MKHTVFIDGREGTTGLELEERLSAREELELLEIDPALRKDPSAREKLLNAADVAFLCLPDAAAREAVKLVHNDRTRIIDSSTAHRTDPLWEYGFPELSHGHRERIRVSRCVAVPGCHATGFTSIIYPLVAGGILPQSYPVSCHSLTGYSGGGKKMIEQYESGREPADKLVAPRYYALSLSHKH